MNPNFKPEFQQYLEDNGYRKSNPKSVDVNQYFFKGSKGVLIGFDAVDAAEFGPSNVCHSSSSFSGISTLNIEGWKMLMHIMGVIECPQYAPQRKVTIEFDEPVTEHA